MLLFFRGTGVEVVVLEVVQQHGMALEVPA
jgi:hypothetical protein